jgi:hypothetical protein
MAVATAKRRSTNLKTMPVPSPRRAASPAWKISDAAFVATLKSRGVTLSLDGENLRVEAPRGTLSDFDQERLWHHMDGVRSVLAGEQRQMSAIRR